MAKARMALAFSKRLGIRGVSAGLAGAGCQLQYGGLAKKRAIFAEQGAQGKSFPMPIATSDHFTSPVAVW
jgi:hypothetical protein